MDPIPDGPRKLQGKGLVTIPEHLQRAVGLQLGDDVWLVVNPDKPGTLVVIPANVMAEIFKKGWTAV